MEKEININDLPIYSPWCAEIMGGEEKGVHYKNPQQVQREYNEEKWKAICNILEKEPQIRLSELEDKVFGDELIPAYLNEKFILVEEKEERKKLYEFYLGKMTPFLLDMECLVELGSGYGSIILNLASRASLGGAKLFSGEYTANGLRAQERLARNEGIDIALGECDFFSLTKSSIFNAAKNGVVFTSWALAYVPQLTSSIIDWFSEFQPQYVIHFEPCYEYYSLESLHGLMCRRYMQINDYNRNLVSVLKEAETKKRIKIEYIGKNLWGSNPFAPISMIVWKPLC